MFIMEHNGINGTTTIGTFKDVIKLITVDLSLGRKGEMKIGSSNRQHTIGSQNCAPIHVSKMLDSSSIDIIQQCTFGTSTEVKLYMLGVNNKKVLEITLADCVLNDYQLNGHTGIPLEKFYLTFTRIAIRYIPETGSPRGTTFNLTTGAM